MSAQPLVQGKLMEVDVPGSGPRAGAGAEVDELSRPQHAQPQQQRAPEDAGGGRRKRRTSEDMKRDKMVEEFLHENRRKYPGLCHAKVERSKPLTCAT